MRRKTHQEFILDMESKNSNIVVLGTYTNSKVKIKVECRVCGHIWFSKPNTLLTGHGCPKCAKRYNRTHDEFVFELKSINPNIDILSQFKNTGTKVECNCKVCGNHWSCTPQHLLDGVGCPKCKHIELGKARKVSNEEFIKRMKKANKNIEILSEYVYALQKVDCRCNVCGNVWSATPANLLNGHGCPMCNESKGEKKIYSYLVEKGILFETQKKYDGLLGANDGSLSYDFYLPNQNLLIEYQGIQHNRPIDFKGKGTQYSNWCFSVQKEHDKRKRDYAAENGINLLEIWYRDFENVFSILDKMIDLDLEKQGESLK